VSRIVDQLANNIDLVETAFDKVCTQAREQIWDHCAKQTKTTRVSALNPVIIDIDATLVNVHSDKEGAAPTYKRGYGFHPVISAVDHPHFGEVTGIRLRPGNAGANTATDLIDAVDHAIAGLPEKIRVHPEHILVRSDSGGFTHEFINHLENLGVQYSVSRPMIAWMLSFLNIFPDQYKENALDTTGQARDDAFVIEVGNAHEYLKGTPWPKNMRIIYRAEPLHPGASGTWVDSQGRRITAIATNSPHQNGIHAQHLDVRHRKRARMEQTISRLKNTGLNSLPYKTYKDNRVWLLIVRIASLLLNWLASTALTGKTKRWIPKTMRYRLFHVAGRITRHAHKTRTHIATHPWAQTIKDALNRLQKLCFP
jgi:hypothetical protein